MAEIYCVDTSSFSELRAFRRDVFPRVWTKTEELIAQGRLIAPHEVLRELAKRNTDIYEWAKGQSIFVELDDAQVAAVRDIQQRFNITDHDATGPVADELVVALPLSRIAGQLLSPDRYIVVTQESPGGRGATKIPNVCEAFGLECVRLADLFLREGLRFE